MSEWMDNTREIRSLPKPKPKRGNGCDYMEEFEGANWWIRGAPSFEEMVRSHIRPVKKKGRWRK